MCVCVYINQARTVTPVLLWPENAAYDKILVSVFGGGYMPTLQMVADHFPDVYLLAIVRSALAYEPVSELALQLNSRLTDLLGKIPAMPASLTEPSIHDESEVVQ